MNAIGTPRRPRAVVLSSAVLWLWCAALTEYLYWPKATWEIAVAWAAAVVFGAYCMEIARNPPASRAERIREWENFISNLAHGSIECAVFVALYCWIPLVAYVAVHFIVKYW